MVPLSPLLSQPAGPNLSRSCPKRLFAASYKYWDGQLWVSWALLLGWVSVPYWFIKWRLNKIFKLGAEILPRVSAVITTSSSRSLYHVSQLRISNLSFKQQQNCLRLFLIYTVYTADPIMQDFSSDSNQESGMWGLALYWWLVVRLR